MRRSRLLAAATSGVLLLGVLPAASSAAAAAPARTTPSGDSVTLITGDRVVTHGKAVSVQPGTGRAKVRFLSQTIQTHRYVIPSDALPLLKAGRLDKQLFDVTELLVPV